MSGAFYSGRIEPITDPKIRENLMRFLAVIAGADDDLSNLPGCWLGQIADYITDCPGYAGPVYVVVWSGSPTLVNTVTVNENGEFEIAADSGV